MSRSSEPEDAARLYGANILFWRNNSKLTPQLVAQRANIALERYQMLEEGKDIPTAEEISALAEAFVVNQRDLVPLLPDADKGIKVCTWADILNSLRTITRNGHPHYSYADLALSREVPQMRPEYLKILVTEDGKVVLNNGHVLHQLTFLLHGQLEFYWRWPPAPDGEVHRRIFNERDSWFIRAYVPHAFRSTRPEDLAEIIAFTFSSGLTTDAVKELQMLGPDAAQRIGSGDRQWYSEKGR
jgi:transcriptional regulator with XRE-family HTH domain